MSQFVNDLEAGLLSILPGFDVAEELRLLEPGLELKDGPLEATEFQWFVLEEVLSSLQLQDDLFEASPNLYEASLELLLLLRYLAQTTESTRSLTKPPRSAKLAWWWRLQMSTALSLSSSSE